MACLGFNGSNGLLMTTESVPFRYTPNLQQLVGPIGTEALLCPGIVAIARALTKPEVCYGGSYQEEYSDCVTSTT